MIEDRIVKIADKEFVMNFPSLGRIREFGRLLKFDPLRQGIDKADLAGLIEDETALDAFVKLILGDRVDVKGLLDTITGGDLFMLSNAFFLKGHKAHLTLSNGLNNFVDSYNMALEQKPQSDIPSTSPSITSAKEIQN